MDYLTPQQVRDRYQGRISLQTLANWRYQGTGPQYLKLGGRVLYPLAELLAWERERISKNL
jgi:hypothetical protein